jgi:hypothetical protein
MVVDVVSVVWRECEETHFFPDNRWRWSLALALWGWTVTGLGMLEDWAALRLEMGTEGAVLHQEKVQKGHKVHPLCHNFPARRHHHCRSLGLYSYYYHHAVPAHHSGH